MNGKDGAYENGAYEDSRNWEEGVKEHAGREQNVIGEQEPYHEKAEKASASWA